MYINPTLAGILGTLLIEVALIMFGSLLAYLDRKGDEDGKDNDNQSNQ